MKVKAISKSQCSILDMLVVLGNLCGQLLVSQYCLPSYTSDKLCISSMVLVYAIPLINMEYMISYRQMCYLVNRLGIQFSPLYKPNS